MVWNSYNYGEEATIPIRQVIWMSKLCRTNALLRQMAQVTWNLLRIVAIAGEWYAWTNRNVYCFNKEGLVKLFSQLPWLYGFARWFKGFEKGIARLSSEQRAAFFSECSKNCVDGGVLSIYRKLYKDANGDMDVFFQMANELPGSKKRDCRERSCLSSYCLPYLHP